MEENSTDRVESTLNNATSQPPGSSSQDGTHGAHVSGNEIQDSTAPEAKRQSIPLSDTYNAQALVQAYGSDLLYCHPWKKWLVWSGTHWPRDTSGVVMRYARNTVMGLTTRRKELPKDTAKMLSVHRKKSLSAPRLKAMVELAQSWPDIAVQPIQFDSDHWLLNCLNGTLDLRVGILRPHERNDLLTKCLPVAYDRSAQCPLWLNFLHEIMGGKEHLIAFLQRVIGYTLTGSTQEQCFFLLHGSGANGKSTLIETLHALLGEYAQSIPSASLFVKRYEGIPNDIARMRGVRVITAVEFGKKKQLDEELVKRLTGQDILTARFLYGEYFDFRPDFKLLVACNDLPDIRHAQYALLRRIRLIPFNVTIPPERQNKHLAQVLRAELLGILAWAVQGCLLWQQEGLGEPDEVQQATASYRDEMDVLSQFITECCLEGPEYKARSSDLYETYKRWCEGNGEQAELSQRAFGSALQAKGFERYTSNGTWYRGLGLLGMEEELKSESA